MKGAIVAAVLALLVPGALAAGELEGRILTDAGRPLAGAEVELAATGQEGEFVVSFATSRYGRYWVELPDGAYENCEFTIEEEVYAAGELEVYGRTEVNWRMDEEPDAEGRRHMRRVE